MASILLFKLSFVKNLRLNYFSQDLVSFNFRGDNARVFQLVSMNLHMPVGHATRRLLCRYSSFVSVCVA